ncbi:MAG: preprotein translocase subunit YajC [Magnetococcales bacterium]|nr:preprotein translocase subunit YajC [Magnetococcales bacterium]NGZ27476.1 preprotein translocase subunit YajC [Magnetococcales bacterium]
MIFSISEAFAQSGSSSTGAAVGNIIFMFVLLAIFYFLILRPQKKQADAHKQMIENLQRDDSVVTSGGILGRVHRIDDDIAVVDVGEVEVSPKVFKPVRVKIRKSTITAVTVKAGLPVESSEASK